MSKRHPIESVTAIILAGGLGTRLRATVGNRPKPLAQINGRPFLDYQVAQLARAGVGEVMICVGYDAQSVVDAMGATCHGARLRYLRDWPLRGTGGALRSAIATLNAPTVMVLNGDSYSNADLPRLVAGHAANRKAQCTMLLAWCDDRSAFGGATLDEEGRIAAFQEKQPGIGPGYVNAGVYLFERSALAAIRPERTVSLEREVLPGLVGHGLYGWPDEAAFIDIGTPESYCRAHAFLRPHASIEPDAPVTPAASLRKDAAA
ncbi:MAG: sugar phosphate nucleotidyltransferase [Alphaproteobacteria bacterium]